MLVLHWFSQVAIVYAGDEGREMVPTGSFAPGGASPRSLSLWAVH